MKLYFFFWNGEKARETAKTQTSRAAALIVDVEKDGVAEMRSGIKSLFESISGYELGDAVIERV